MEKNTLATGFSYMARGSKLLTQKGIRPYVLVPLFANLVVFVLLTLYLLNNFGIFQAAFTSWLPDWKWIAYIVSFISGLVIFLILLIYGYSFSILTNIIAAPFYGVLAEKIEHKITGISPPQESINTMIKRTLQRELIKLWYFMSRGLMILIGLFFLSFIPLLNLLVPIIGILWGAWVMALQYADYPADNHQVSFIALRKILKKQRYSSLGLGGTIMLASMVPVINIFIMPIAVAGGTLLWVEELKHTANQ